ncbi:ATPase-AAA-core domain-containing protein [Mycena venus]|uniref:ATPase-AAA-core domain-containing protein n=1 Tax=Mycena venus TaxID=2733690 RepID=A0A8H6YWK7_9AGAR|nr:ATPase-AAA-core domain-containing protein [Mycena venus]
MPLPPTPGQTRLNNSIGLLSAAVGTLDLLAKSLNLPFLKPISAIAQSLLTSAESVRNNKNECIKMLDQIHDIIYGIVELHIKSDIDGQLSPKFLEPMGQFAETLQKVFTFVDAQQEKSKFKQLLRQSEMNALLKDCTAKLQQAVDVFKLQSARLLLDAKEIQEYGQQTHEDVLAMINSLSEANGSDTASSVDTVFFGDYNSSNSLSLLPSEPKIFHGRDSEILDLVKMFSHETPRIAILGPGGIGKTSLAKAIFHHEEIANAYDCRVFVACDSASTKQGLAALIGGHLGLPSTGSTSLTTAIIDHLSRGRPCLLVLDNLETSWEPLKSRKDVEDFLSSLTDIAHLALIITMRGAERPTNIRWTHPFLPPLRPLTEEAARETFLDIAGDEYDDSDIDKILALSGNIPLAIDLISHLVSAAGCLDVLSRWETETTSLVSEGYDRSSNLDLSISLSLTSPRIASVPHSVDLLSLLSMLPDGLSDVELLQSNLPLNNILACKAALLRTSLGYSDHGRLKALAPICEYMQRHRPPGSGLVYPLLSYFMELAKIYRKYYVSPENGGTISRITSNQGNIQNILVHGLHRDDRHLTEAIEFALTLVEFGRVHSWEDYWVDILDRIPTLIDQQNNHTFEIRLIIEKFASWPRYSVDSPEDLIDKALEHFKHLDDPSLQCTLYMVIGYFHRIKTHDIRIALKFLKEADSLSNFTGSKEQSRVSCQLAWAYFSLGDYRAAQVTAYEAQRQAKLAGYSYGEATALHLEATCWHKLGDYKRAAELCQSAQDVLAHYMMPNKQVEHAVRNLEIEIHTTKSEYSEAYNLTRHMISLERGQHNYLFILINVTVLEIMMGTDKHTIDTDIEQARSLCATLGRMRLVSWCDTLQAALDLREKNFSVALQTFRKCLRSSWGTDDEHVTFCLERLGDVTCWGPTQSMASWTIVFLVHALKTKQNLAIYRALQFVGNVFLGHHDPTTAANLFTVALEGFTQMDVHRSRAECMLYLGDIARTLNDYPKALHLWDAARPLFERSSQTHHIVLVDERFATVMQQISGAS